MISAINSRFSLRFKDTKRECEYHENMSELCPLTYHTVIPVPVIISRVASRGPAGFQIGLHLIMMMLGLSALIGSRPVIYHCGGGNKSAASLALLIGCLRSSETPAAMLSVRTPWLKSGND